MELKCSKLQKELLALQEEVNVANSLQEEMTIQGSPSSLAAHMTELKDDLKHVEERYKVASSSVEEKALQVEKYHKNAQALKALQEEVFSLRWVFLDAFDQTMWDLLEV